MSGTKKHIVIVFDGTSPVFGMVPRDKTYTIERSITVGSVTISDGVTLRAARSMSMSTETI